MTGRRARRGSHMWVQPDTEFLHRAEEERVLDKERGARDDKKIGRGDVGHARAAGRYYLISPESGLVSERRVPSISVGSLVPAPA